MSTTKHSLRKPTCIRCTEVLTRSADGYWVNGGDVSTCLVFSPEFPEGDDQPEPHELVGPSQYGPRNDNTMLVGQ